MTPARTLIGAGLAIGLALGAWRQAQDPAGDTGPENATSGAGLGDGLAGVIDALNPWAVMEANAMQIHLNHPNVRAMLDAISWAEGTAHQPDPYRVCYGYRHTLQSLAQHPAISGEWTGEPLDSLGPRYAGLKSTAAGRYQINRPTWVDCAKAMGLTNFGPLSQDLAAVWLISKAGALELLKAGELDAAVYACRTRWASLPGSGAGQPERRRADFARAYADAGGAVA